MSQWRLLLSRRGSDPQAIDGAAAADPVDDMAKKLSAPDRSQGLAGQPARIHADLENGNDGLRAHGAGVRKKSPSPVPAPSARLTPLNGQLS